jgi:hypothetical protein
MLEPKQKAKELFDKIVEIQLLSKKLYYPNLTHEIAKQCALIAVNEILNVPDLDYNNQYYWEDFKQEIEKL